MSWPAYKLVDAPTITAAVLFDFNPGPDKPPGRWVLRQGMSLGAASVEGEYDAIDPLYGPREIQFTVRIAGTKTVSLGQQAQMARQLMVGRGWLLFQPNALTKPVWFRTYLPTPGEVSWENFAADATEDLWDIPVRIPAGPFAYGERITQSVQTLNNNAAHATNPCRIVLPAILGDVPTPIRVDVNPSNATGTPGFRWMIAMHSGATQRTPTLWTIGTADGFTAGTDTSGATADAAYTGGSYRTVSFATVATLVDRVSGATPATLAPGKYKLLAHTDRTDNASIFSLRFGVRVGFGYSYGTTVTTARAASTAASHATWVDLGDFAIPQFAPPQGENPGITIAPNIALQVARVSGAGTLRLDAILAVPLETTDTVRSSAQFSEFPTVGIGSGASRGVWDSTLERFWSYNNFGVAEAAECRIDGYWPRAVPGASNVLTMLQQVNGSRPFFGDDSPDVISVNTAVTISYQPLYLNVAEA